MTSHNKLLKIDGILWQVIEDVRGTRRAQPICPKHHIRLKPGGDTYSLQNNTTRLYCAEAENELFRIPRSFSIEKEYVIDKIDAIIFKGMKVINIDEEAVPLSKARIDTSKENPFWIEAKLLRSKSGLILVIYAGEKGKRNKTQIFVEPGNKRLSFDQNDTPPTEVFTKLEATFEDGTKHTIKKSKE